MPNILSETDVDPIAEQVDNDIVDADELAWSGVVNPGDFAGNLGDGGKVGNATLTPMQGRQKQQKGRPVARHAWMWNGTETLLPLAWNTEGTQHDGARSFLLKRHCNRCKFSGFKPNAKTGLTCPNCGANGKGVIVPAFYLRFQDVPEKLQVYGHVDCFLATCVRRGEWGFKDESQMRMHAMSRHRMEYQAYRESQQLSATTELEALRVQVNALLLKQLNEVQSKPVATPTAPVVPVEVIPPEPVSADRSAMNRLNALRGWEKRRAKQAKRQAVSA